MYKRTVKGWLRNLDFILLDECCLLLVLLLTVYPGVGGGFAVQDANPPGLIVLILAFDLFVMAATDSLEGVLTRGYVVELKYTLRHGFYLLSITVLGMIVRGTPVEKAPASILAAILLYLALGYASRVLWRRFLRRHPRKREKQKLMLIVTDEKSAPDIVARMRQYSFERYALAGLVIIDRDAKGDAVAGVPVVANLKDAADYICRAWVDEVFFFHASLDDRAQELLLRCREMALTVHLYFALQGVDERKQTLEHLAGYRVLTANMNLMSLTDAFIKRAFDITAGLIGSLAALPVVAVAGLLIRKESPGPLLLRQERVGENGKRFKMYKIRSMYVDAEARKQEFAQANSHTDGMLFKMDFDPRVVGNRLLPDGTKKTGVGDFIRRTGLDEFPQFFNVLKGDMSVVGTRPPTVDEWERYQYHHRARLSIRPGVTGLWQVHKGKDHMPFDEVVRLDTEYIAHWSVGLDLRIILKTVRRLFGEAQETHADRAPDGGEKR